MTKRTRILLVVLGLATLAAAAWIMTNSEFRLREVSYTDDSIDVELIPPPAPPPAPAPATN